MEDQILLKLLQRSMIFLALRISLSAAAFRYNRASIIRSQTSNQMENEYTALRRSLSPEYLTIFDNPQKDDTSNKRTFWTSAMSYLKDASLVRASIIDLLTSGLDTNSNDAYIPLVPRSRPVLLLHLRCRTANKSVVHCHILVASIIFVKRKAW